MIICCVAFILTTLGRSTDRVRRCWRLTLVHCWMCAAWVAMSGPMRPNQGGRCRFFAGAWVVRFDVIRRTRRCAYRPAEPTAIAVIRRALFSSLMAFAYFAAARQVRRRGFRHAEWSQLIETPARTYHHCREQAVVFHPTSLYRWLGFCGHRVDDVCNACGVSYCDTANWRSCEELPTLVSSR